MTNGDGDMFGAFGMIFGVIFIAFVLTFGIGAASSCMDDKISRYHRQYHVKPVSSEPCCCIGKMGPKHCR